MRGFLKRVLVLMIVALGWVTVSQATPANYENVTKIYVATFNRAPDHDGLEWWVHSGYDLETIAKRFFYEKETVQKYPPGLSNREFVRQIYLNLFNREPEKEGWDWWTQQLDSGKRSRDLLILDAINGAQNSDAAVLSNKTTVGLEFAESGSNDGTCASDVMSVVTADPESVAQAREKMSLCSGDFKSVSEALNTKSLSLNAAVYKYINDYNALMAIDPTVMPEGGATAPLDELLASTQKMLNELEDYQALLSRYHAMTSTTKGIQTRQSVDPLLIWDIKNLIKKGVEEQEILQQMSNQGYSEEEVLQAMHDKTIKHLKEVTNFGASAVFGGGAAAFAGLALGAAGAPVLVVVGGATAVGLAAGAFFSWCTGGSKSISVRSQNTQICSMASITSHTVKLANGQHGVIFSLPAGSGDLCMHIEGKAPLCFNADVKKDGTTLTLGCLANTSDADGAKECSNAVENDDGIAVQGSNCATDVYSISATPVSVSSSGATVAIKTNLPTSGCMISYSLVGTDGYTQSGSLITDSAGGTRFHVPAGKPGVHDSVSATATESGATTHAGYTF